jgi:hypothetical protein
MNQFGTDRFAHTPFNSIANNSVAQRPGNRESHARRPFGILLPAKAECSKKAAIHS